MIGITHRVTTPVGPPHQAISQYTTHVQPVGVFQMVVVMVYGQRQDLVPEHTIGQMEGCLSSSHHLPQLGILLRVVATTTMAVSTMSVAAAAIGLPLLSATARTSCTSTAMAASIRLTAAVARTASQSVVSKNNF